MIQFARPRYVLSMHCDDVLVVNRQESPASPQIETVSACYAVNQTHCCCCANLTDTHASPLLKTGPIVTCRLTQIFISRRFRHSPSLYRFHLFLNYNCQYRETE